MFSIFGERSATARPPKTRSSSVPKREKRNKPAGLSQRRLSTLGVVVVKKNFHDDDNDGNDTLSPLLGAASARLGSSSLEQQDATIG